MGENMQAYLCNELVSEANPYSDMASLMNAENIMLSELSDCHILRRLDDALFLNINQLADIYCSVGMFSGAELLLRRLLQTQEHILGAKHAQVAQNLLRLTALLRSVDRSHDAELMEIRAMLKERSS